MTGMISIQQQIRIVDVTVTGIDSADYSMANFKSLSSELFGMTIVAITPKADAGFSSKPISIIYNGNNDTLYVRTTASPSNGTLSLRVAYYKS